MPYTAITQLTVFVRVSQLNFTARLVNQMINEVMKRAADCYSYHKLTLQKMHKGCMTIIMD